MMSARLTRETIHFHRSFILPGVGEPLPSGRYEVEFEEERMDGLSFTAWRTVRTTLRRIDATNGLSFALDVGAEALKAAIAGNIGQDTATLAAPAAPAASAPPETTPVERAAKQMPGWRDFIVPPVVIPAAIAVAALAAFILGPFQ